MKKNYFIIGIAAGLAIGSALHNIAIGLALGVGIGLALSGNTECLKRKFRADK